MTQKQAIAKIKSRIGGCARTMKKHAKMEDFAAATDMKSRIDGLKIALAYVKEIDDTKGIKKKKPLRGQII